LFKSGYVAIIGLPNAGKSCFFNKVLGEKVSAVSSKPQMTRNKINGIFNTPNSQIVFLDTPGLHKSPKEINNLFTSEALKAVKDADVTVYMFDPFNVFANKDAEFFEIVKQNAKKLIVTLSKVDSLKNEEIEEYHKKIKSTYGVDEVISLSSFKSFGIKHLTQKLIDFLPENPAYYPDDIITDRDLRFLCSELIRESIFNLTKAELPYSTAVEILKYEETPKLHKIFADIIVERDSQKAIIIGSKASLIKKIGQESRKAIEKLVDCKVYLELFVKVKSDWTKDSQMLKELGYK